MFQSNRKVSSVIKLSEGSGFGWSFLEGSTLRRGLYLRCISTTVHNRKSHLLTFAFFNLDLTENPSASITFGDLGERAVLVTAAEVAILPLRRAARPLVSLASLSTCDATGVLVAMAIVVYPN